MMRKKYFILFLIIIPLHAASTDDEIIKNLDFYQNIELLKEDNPFIGQLSNSKNENVPANMPRQEITK